MTQDSRIGDESTILTITGTGIATQGTGLITIQAGVETFGLTAAASMRDNSDVMAALRSQLERLGVAPRDIRTTQLNLSHGYDPSNGKTKGFTVRHLLTLVFREIDKSGGILDALVNAGANQIHGPNFSWEPSEEALRVARLEAIRDAEERAGFFAEALGLRIKRIITMRDQGGMASGRPSVSARMASGTEISPGEDVVRASVHAEFELVRQSPE